MSKLKIDYKESLLNAQKCIAEQKSELTKLENERNDYRDRYESLQGENAELKEKIEVLECDNYNANCNLNLITDQLTKAKEHIRTLISCLIDWVQEGDKDYCYKDIILSACETKTTIY